MIGLSRAVRIFVHSEPVDMRKSFDTLAAVARLTLGADVLRGDVFVFVGRRRRHAKVLWWDGTGILVLAKRLAKGRFAAPWERRATTNGRLEWTLSELALFLEGSELVTRIDLSPPIWKPSDSTIAFG